MERMKNALLFVIALCLVLVVLRLYSFGDFVKEVRAESAPTAHILDVHLYGCSSGATDCYAWRPVFISPTGMLYVKPGPGT